MEVKSTYKYARISPKKARDVARAIQGMPVSDALDALAYTPRKAAQFDRQDAQERRCQCREQP